MSGAVTVTGYLRDGCTILAPEIEVSYNATYLIKNYAYIPDFGRYYYYTMPPTIEGKVMVLHLRADSVYNYAAQIKMSQCIAERSSSHYDVYLPDSAVIGEQGYNYYSRTLPYTFDPANGEYVLTVAGGV